MYCSSTWAHLVKISIHWNSTEMLLWPSKWEAHSRSFNPLMHSKVSTRPTKTGAVFNLNLRLYLTEMWGFFFLFFLLFCIISLLHFWCLCTFRLHTPHSSSPFCRTLPPVESLSGCSRFTQLHRSPPAAVPSLFIPHSFYFATHTRAVLLNYITERAVRQKKSGGRKKETVASLLEEKTDFFFPKKKRCVSGGNAHGNKHCRANTDSMHEIKTPRRVCINLAGLISSIWTWRLMHLLRLLAAMSSAAAGWARPIIS